MEVQGGRWGEGGWRCREGGRVREDGGVGREVE